MRRIRNCYIASAASSLKPFVPGKAADVNVTPAALRHCLDSQNARMFAHASTVHSTRHQRQLTCRIKFCMPPASLAQALALLAYLGSTSRMAEQDQQDSRYYSFKPISSPLTYSVRDSADSLNSDSTERSFSMNGAFSRVVPKTASSKFGHTQPNHAQWRGYALQVQAADSDIESDISPEQSPPKPRRARPARPVLSVLPLTKTEGGTSAETERRGEAEGAVHLHNPRDSGLYSYSPSNSGEDYAMAASAAEVDLGPTRKIRPPVFPHVFPHVKVGRNDVDLVVSPSAVSVRMEASDEHGSPTLPRFSPLGEETGMHEPALKSTREDRQGLTKSPSQQPLFLSGARESRLKLLQSGGLEEFSAVAAEQLQLDKMTLSQSPFNQTITLRYHATPIITLEETPDASPVSKPYDPRIVGRVVKTKAGNVHQVELHKPPDRPFGFVIAKGTVNDKTAVYVSKFRDGYPEKFFTGLLRTGDKIVAVNGVKVKRKSIDSVQELMKSSNTLLLTVKPKLLSSDW